MNTERSPVAAARRLAILVADDERDTVITLEAILSDEGHVVHAVYRGDHVLEAVQRYRPEVCILDIDLPGRSGYSLAEELDGMGSADRPLLIGISGKYKSSSDQLLARMVGFDRFFTKPADPRELLQCLNDLTTRRNRTG